MGKLLMEKLSKKDGFTLIELIIVITLVGIVVASLVGIFGNPLREASVDSAASQIGDHMRSISDGADYYYSKTTTEATTMSDLTSGANATLKTSPVAPLYAKSSSYTGTYEYVLDTMSYTEWVTTAADTVVVLDGLTDAVCTKINEKFTGQATIYMAVQADKDIQCVSTGMTFVALKVVYAR
jgi:prepilin-type N-terminal cleavage/methylation domain-containing protein